MVVTVDLCRPLSFFFLMAFHEPGQEQWSLEARELGAWWKKGQGL